MCVRNRGAYGCFDHASLDSRSPRGYVCVSAIDEVAWYAYTVARVDAILEFSLGK